MAENLSNEEKLINERLKFNLRKMIKSFDYYIKEAESLDELEDHLKHMEETDENFHKHELVESLADRIETLLGNSIDKHVNEAFANSSQLDCCDIDLQSRMAQTICDDIMRTREFTDFQTQFQSSMQRANDYLLKNFPTNFIEPAQNNTGNKFQLNFNNSMNHARHQHKHRHRPAPNHQSGSNTNNLDSMTTNTAKSITFTNCDIFSREQCFSFSEDNQSSSTLNNNGPNQSFVFFNSEQFPTIASQLDSSKNNNEQQRIRAMQQLLTIPAGDPQSAEHWQHIRPVLLQCLRDSNKSKQLADLCLKLHSRTLASSHYKVTSEIYITLIEHIKEYFQNPSSSSSNTNNQNQLFMFKAMRLLNDYARDVTGKWTRYPQNFIQTIIDETLKLFSLENPKQQQLTPMHYMSLLDTQASWFVKWMHGHNSRQVLINSMKSHEQFIQNAVSSVLNYLQQWTPNQMVPQQRKRSDSFVVAILEQQQEKSNNQKVVPIKKRTSYKRNEIEYAHFVHSINVLRRVLCFQNGRKLFPVRCLLKDSSSSSLISLNEFIKTIIQLIQETTAGNTNYHNQRSRLQQFAPFKCAYDLLLDLCVAESTCRACLCNEDVIEQLLKPLKHKMNPQVQSQKEKKLSNPAKPIVYDETCMLIVANVLSKMASNECGYRQLLCSDAGQHKFNPKQQEQKSTAAHCIALFVRKALNNQLNNNEQSFSTSTIEISEYLYLVRLLYSQCQGAFLIKDYELNKSISEAWRLSDKEKKTEDIVIVVPNSNKEEEDLFVTFPSWCDSLLDNLVSMASTPKGVFYLNETELLGEVTQYLIARYRNKMQVGKYEKFGYGFILSQVSNAPSGCHHLNENELIKYLIEEIWTELEHGSDDFLTAFPRCHSVEPVDRDVYKHMLCLVNILSSFSAVYELLADVTATPRSVYGRDQPKGLIGLLDRVVFLDKKSKMNSLCNYTQSHTFGLRLLSYLQTDLDVLLLLECQYGYTQLLLNLQMENKPNRAKYNFNNPENIYNEEPEDEEEEETIKNENTKIIIDQLSVERNFVLVSANLIGGCSERVLPTRYLMPSEQEDKVNTTWLTKDHVYPYPMFDRLPVPECYVATAWDHAQSRHHLIDDTFAQFIKQFDYDTLSKNTEDFGCSKWLYRFRNLYYTSFRSGSRNGVPTALNVNVMPTALEQIVRVYLGTEANCFQYGNSEFKNFFDFQSKAHQALIGNLFQLNALQKLGIQKSVQYGLQLKRLVESKKDLYQTQLIQLMRMIKFLLKPKPTTNKTTSYLNYCQEEHLPSYDWFTATVYLMHNGDLEASLKFLYEFHSLTVSGFVWPARLYGNEQLLTRVHVQNGISVLLGTTCHYIELILKTELPFVFSAFRMSGIAPSQICSNWLKQCFWNYLDWCDVVTYLSICIVFGVDYQTYFCVAILRHLNEKSTEENKRNGQKIIQHHTNRDLQIYLKVRTNIK